MTIYFGICNHTFRMKHTQQIVVTVLKYINIYDK